MPHITMVSPGLAGVLALGKSVAGPISDRPSACVAAIYLAPAPITKKEGAINCVCTFAWVLFRLLLVTFTRTIPPACISAGVSTLICFGLI